MQTRTAYKETARAVVAARGINRGALLCPRVLQCFNLVRITMGSSLVAVPAACALALERARRADQVWR